MFCPPTGAKYHFFEDPAHGLLASFCCNIVVSLYRGSGRSGARTFKPLGLWQLDVKFGVCLINAKMFFKKAPILSELLISVSKLFHSITDKKKNYFSVKEKYALSRT